MDTTELNRARAAALNGLSPRERGQQKIIDCLLWLYHWGWSSAEILRRVSGAAQPIVPRLVAAGLARKIQMNSGGIKGRPVFVVGLTPDGLTEAMRNTEIVASYSDRIREMTLIHDLFVQNVVLTLLKNGTIQDYWPARHMEGKAGKIPDAIGLIVREHEDEPRNMLIEIELEQKTGEKFDLFASRLIEYLEMSSANSLLIATDRGAVSNWYKRRFSEGSTFRLIKASGKGTIQNNQSVDFTIDDSLAKRITVAQIG